MLCYPDLVIFLISKGEVYRTEWEILVDFLTTEILINIHIIY